MQQPTQHQHQQHQMMRHLYMEPRRMPGGVQGVPAGIQLMQNPAKHSAPFWTTNGNPVATPHHHHHGVFPMPGQQMMFPGHQLPPPPPNCGGSFVYFPIASAANGGVVPGPMGGMPIRTPPPALPPPQQPPQQQQRSMMEPPAGQEIILPIVARKNTKRERKHALTIINPDTNEIVLPGYDAAADERALSDVREKARISRSNSPENVSNGLPEVHPQQIPIDDAVPLTEDFISQEAATIDAQIEIKDISSSIIIESLIMPAAIQVEGDLNSLIDPQSTLSEMSQDPSSSVMSNMEYRKKSISFPVEDPLKNELVLDEGTYQNYTDVIPSSPVEVEVLPNDVEYVESLSQVQYTEPIIAPNEIEVGCINQSTIYDVEVSASPDELSKISTDQPSTLQFGSFDEQELSKMIPQERSEKFPALSTVRDRETDQDPSLGRYDNRKQRQFGNPKDKRQKFQDRNSRKDKQGRSWSKSNTTNLRSNFHRGNSFNNTENNGFTPKQQVAPTDNSNRQEKVSSDHHRSATPQQLHSATSKPIPDNQQDRSSPDDNSMKSTLDCNSNLNFPQEPPRNVTQEAGSSLVADQNQNQIVAEEYCSAGDGHHYDLSNRNDKKDKSSNEEQTTFPAESIDEFSKSSTCDIPDSSFLDTACDTNETNKIQKSVANVLSTILGPSPGATTIGGGDGFTLSQEQNPEEKPTLSPSPSPTQPTETHSAIPSASFSKTISAVPKRKASFQSGSSKVHHHKTKTEDTISTTPPAVRTDDRLTYSLQQLYALREAPASKVAPEFSRQTTSPVLCRPLPESVMPPFMRKSDRSGGESYATNSASSVAKTSHTRPYLKTASLVGPVKPPVKSARSEIIHVSLSLHDEVKLNLTENAWRPMRLQGKDIVDAKDSDEKLAKEVLLRKVRGILNKLTPDNFASLVNEVINLRIDTAEKVSDVMVLIFEKVIDEPNFSTTYACLCQKLAENDIQSAADEKQATGSISRGRTIKFKNILIDRTQTEFDNNVIDQKAKEQKLKPIMKSMNECRDIEKKAELKAQLEEEEGRIRRRCTGTVRFIGELFKCSLLTGFIIDDCISKLLDPTSEDKLECLCKLVTTVGQKLEKTPKKERGKFYCLDDVFSKMQNIANRKAAPPKISSRIRFMILDVIDLRRNNWKSKDSFLQCKTIDPVQFPT